MKGEEHADEIVEIYKERRNLVKTGDLIAMRYPELSPMSGHSVKRILEMKGVKIKRRKPHRSQQITYTFKGSKAREDYC